MKIGSGLLAIALLLYKVQAQFCGPPILPPPPLHPPVCPNPSLIQSVTPAVGTTIIDTSLSSALANVLQLLIVSDLIESTLNTALGHHSVPVTPVCEPVVQPIVYTPTVEVTPCTEFFSPPCSPIEYVPTRGPKVDILPRHGPVIDYVPPCAPIDYKPPCIPPFDFIPQYGPIVDYSPPCPTVIDLKPPCPPIFDFAPQFGPVIDYLPAPIIDFAPPCPPVFDIVPQYGPVIDFAPPGPIFEFAPPCATFIEPLPNFYGECVAQIPVNGPTNYCGFNEYVTNVTPMYGMPEIIGPVQMAPVVPNCYNGLNDVIGPRISVGPVTTEFLYPTNVPAQMCNIGNMPSSLPFVSVDPIPCGCGYGNNIVGNTYYY